MTHTYTLHSVKGWGSTVAEAMLELLEIPYANTYYDKANAAARDVLAPWNPLKQVPTLVRSDGLVMTESAAIALWLVNEHWESSIALPDDDKARALMHRWIVYLAVNVYGAVITGDFPDRWVTDPAGHADFETRARARARECWQAFDAQVQPAPYLLGNTMSALDVYAAVIGRWVGKDWREANCPKTSAAMRLTEQHPIIAKVWARNFG